MTTMVSRTSLVSGVDANQQEIDTQMEDAARGAFDSQRNVMS